MLFCFHSFTFDSLRLYSQIKRLVPVLKYYHRAWPINAFLKQYLKSSASKYRKDLQKLSDMNEVPARQKAAISKGADKSNAEDFVSFLSDDSDSETEYESGGESEIDVEELKTNSVKVRYFLKLRLLSN
jgi:hypothetical protein